MDSDMVIEDTMINVNIFIEYLRIFIRNNNSKNIRFEVPENTFRIFQTTNTTKEKLKKNGEIYYLIYFYYNGKIINIYIYNDGFIYSNHATPNKLSELKVVIDDEIGLCLNNIKTGK